MRVAEERRATRRHGQRAARHRARTEACDVFRGRGAREHAALLRPQPVQLRDQLTHVDDTSVASLALEQILDLIKGGEGTKVHLTLWRGERAFRVELRRKRVKQVGLVSTATKRSLNSNNTASAGRKTLSSITTGT